MIGIRLDSKRLPATIQEPLRGSGVAFGFGGMRRELSPRSFVDAVTEDGTIDFEDFDCTMAVWAGDEEGHLFLVCLLFVWRLARLLRLPPAAGAA